MKEKGELAAVSASDPVGTFDPLLSAVNPKEDYPFHRGGYFLWPNPRVAESAGLRLMTVGNSTSLWPASDWSRQMAEMLRANGVDLGLFHGAGKGNTSSQDVLRVIRDAAAIKPHLVVSLSGICDIGHLLNSKGYPFAHKYVRRLLDFTKSYGFARDTVYGYPDPASAAEVWCRNQRIAYVVAKSLGADYLVFLQPVMGFGAYDRNADEAALFDEKAVVVLQAVNKPYGVCVTEFYTEVQKIMAADPVGHAHIVDFTDVFADCPGAFRDHRHQSPEGVTHLARRMLPIVSKRLAELGLERGAYGNV